MALYYPFYNDHTTPWRVMADPGVFGHVKTLDTNFNELVRYSLIEFNTLSANVMVSINGGRVSDGATFIVQQQLGVKRIAGGALAIVATMPAPVVIKELALVLSGFRVTVPGTDILVEVQAPDATAFQWCGQIQILQCFGLP